MNKVLLMGRLSFDPDLKKTQSGLSVCNMSLATMERAERKTTDEVKNHFEYHRLVAWGAKADICASSLKKGSLVFVEGKVRTESYEKNGVKTKTTKIVVDNIKFLGSSETTEVTQEPTVDVAQQYDTPF